MLRVWRISILRCGNICTSPTCEIDSSSLHLYPISNFTLRTMSEHRDAVDQPVAFEPWDLLHMNNCISVGSPLPMYYKQPVNDKEMECSILPFVRRNGNEGPVSSATVVDQSHPVTSLTCLDSTVVVLCQYATVTH